MEGEDVKILQKALKERQYLTSATAPTGYFGSLTLEAVKRLQCEKMSVCSGNADSNGYGLAGPRTRAELGI
jgi:peptidoglycan hydrolase-like protein with peptidoglycan-binding domain